jgi:hypothetical protein
MLNTLRLLLFILVLAAPVKAADEPPLNSLTDKEKSDGWKLLFDGKTTKGWHKYKGKEIGDRWKVVDGALALKHKDGKDGGDIVTDDAFASFELSIEWKVTEGANSGIMYRVEESEDSPGFTGPEYQILDNAKHPDGRKKETSAASCYGLYAPTEDVTKPIGEWNHARIIAKGDHVEHWLNGKKVVKYEFGSDDWNKRVAASKFKEFNKFGLIKKGVIDLQDHGDDVSYRNIKIRALATK